MANKHRVCCLAQIRIYSLSLTTRIFLSLSSSSLSRACIASVSSMFLQKRAYFQQVVSPEELCTENFCKNGFVNYDGNSFDYQTNKYSTNWTKFRTDYIFKKYRYPKMPPEASKEHAKCKHSTKCLRRESTSTNQDDWLKC